MNSSGQNLSVWAERDDLILGSTAPAFPALEEDIETDVLVVGGGIAGLHIAYELLATGISKVVIVEDGKLGSGETGRTTGQLSVDNAYNEFVNIHGAEATALIAESQQAAIDRIEEIIKKHKIDCGFERVAGYMFNGLRPTDKDYDVKILNEIWQAAADTKKLDIELVEDAEIVGFPTGRTIKFNNQGVFHVTQYLKGLAGVITNELGGKIYEKTHLNEWSDSKASQRGVKAVMANGKTVIANTLVMATNVPLQKLDIIDRLSPYRTYALAFKIANKDLSNSGKGAIWWDIEDPYHYVRSTAHSEPGYSLLIVGGEDEKVGQHDDMEERYKRLDKWTRERWTGALEVEYRWSGQVNESMDGIAYIGRDPMTKNIYIHTGDNGDGLTYAAVGGVLIRDLILGRHNELAALYDPGRQFSTSHLLKSLKTLPGYLGKNISNQMYFAKWISTCSKTMTDIEDLAPESGAVVRDGVSPVAVYKDADGKLHKMTAVCPHLKGIVVFNKDEKTFDCPIHGSRFSCKGEVINGPSKGNLTDSQDIVN